MNKKMSITDKWESDIQAYRQGATVNTCIPQCESCRHYVKGDALHCMSYLYEMKPRHVIFPSRECLRFETASPVDFAVNNILQSRLYGAILGFCIGDMLGVPVEFSSRAEREKDPVGEMRAYGVHHQHFGTWSDDTSLMLCLIDAYIRGFTLERLCENMIACYTCGRFTPDGRMFDIGNSTLEAIRRMSSGIEPEKCGGISERDNGNGSLMRILPLAFVCRDLMPDAIIELVNRVSSVTHRHARSVVACLLYTVLAKELWEGQSKHEALDSAISFVQTYCMKSMAHELPAFDMILSKQLLELDYHHIRSSGYVVDTLEAVIWAFMNTSDYRSTVLTATNLGGDTDTIAALAGGLAGMYHGFDALPQNWVQCIARKEMIHDMLSVFCKSISES